MANGVNALSDTRPAAIVPRPDGRTRAILRESGELSVFAGSALRSLPGTARYTAEVLRQAAWMIRGTVPLMFLMAAFIGFTITSYSYFFLRSIGASDYTGLATGMVVPRLGATIMFGYVFTAKICCGIVAELGAARINEEIDGYECEAVDPLKYVIGTRILGALIFMPIGAVVAVVGCTVGSYVDAVWILGGLSAETLLTPHWAMQSAGDQVYVFITVATMALVTVLVGCFYGMRTRGGPAAVGASVARSVVVNLILLHCIGGFWATMFYGTDARLPIGG